jgi:hypothetical protein
MLKIYIGALATSPFSRLLFVRVLLGELLKAHVDRKRYRGLIETKGGKRSVRVMDYTDKLIIHNPPFFLIRN